MVQNERILVTTLALEGHLEIVNMLACMWH